MFLSLPSLLIPLINSTLFFRLFYRLYFFPVEIEEAIQFFMNDHGLHFPIYFVSVKMGNTMDDDGMMSTTGLDPLVLTVSIFVIDQGRNFQ